jgi:hypothetical protein
MNAGLKVAVVMANAPVTLAGAVIALEVNDWDVVDTLLWLAAVHVGGDE